MISQIARLRKEVLERRALDFFHFAVGAIAGVEVVLEKRSEIDLFEGIFLLRSGDRILFSGGGSGALAVFFLLANLVEKRNGILEFLENGILDHLAIDHVLKLELIECEDGDHLHETRSKHLALRELNA